MLSKGEREGLAASKFERFLVEARHKVSFERGGDPPDFVFHVDDQKWYVEVSELHQSDSNGIPLPATLASAEVVTNLVKVRLESTGFSLSTLVFIHFSRAVSRREKEKLVDEIADAIPKAVFGNRYFFGPDIFMSIQGGPADVKSTSLIAVHDEGYFKKPFLDLMKKKLSKFREMKRKNIEIHRLVLLIDCGAVGYEKADMYDSFVVERQIDFEGVSVFVLGPWGIREVKARCN